MCGEFVSVPVVLPCDLPLWPDAQQLLLEVEGCGNIEEVCGILRQLHRLCAISITANDNDASFELALSAFATIVRECFSPEETDKMLSRTLSCMARYALSLQELRPSRGLHFNLSSSSCNSTVALDRRFAASLAANAFFSTFPDRRRSRALLRNMKLPCSENHLSIAAIVGDDTQDSVLRLRSLFTYFNLLEEEEPWGHLYISRTAATPLNNDLARCQQLLNCRLPLAPVYVVNDEGGGGGGGGGGVQLMKANTESIAFATLPCLSSAVWHHPELLVLHLFVEQPDKSSNERVVVRGLLGGRDVSSNNNKARPRPPSSLEAFCFVMGNEVIDERMQFGRIHPVPAFLTLLQDSIDHFNQHGTSNFNSPSDKASSTFSSKSSALSRLAARLSRGHETSPSWSTSTSDGDSSRGERVGFEERLRQAEIRANLEDEDEHDSLRASLPRCSSGSSTPSRSNCCSDRHEWEELLMKAIGDDRNGGDLAVADRARAVQMLADSRGRRALSDSLQAEEVGDPVNAAIGGSKAGSACPRSHSHDIQQRFQEKRDFVDNRAIESAPNEERKLYAWVISENGPFGEQESDFLLLWLSASLTSVPMLVFQSAAAAGLAVHERLLVLCGALERHCDCGSLLREVLTFLESRREGSLMDYLEERVQNFQAED